MALMLQSALDAPDQQPQAGGIDPRLLAQIMSLGSVDQRHKLLQQQIDMGGQTAQGSQVDYSHGKGTPLLLSGLANLISAGVGGYQQGKGMGGLRSLIDKTDAGNLAGAQVGMSAKAPDLQSLLTAPAGQPAADAMRNAQSAIQGQRQAGLALSMSGSPQLAPAGKALYGEAEKGQDTALGMPQARIGLAEGQQKMEAGARAEATATSPVVASGLRDLAKQYGVQIPDTASPGEASALIGPAAKKYEEDTKRGMVPKYAVNPLNGQLYDTHTGKTVTGGSGAPSLSQEATDQLAELFHTTGQLPSVGRGPSAAMTIKTIVNRAAELHPDAGLAGNKAGYKADTGSLAKLQTSADSIDAFENTAIKNLDNFNQVAKGVVDVGSPLFNAPLRAVMGKLAGNPKQAQFNAARQVAIQEVGKVLGGAVAGGVVSDSQRHEVEGLLTGDASLAQIEAVTNTLKQDMLNRKSAVAGQIATIKGRIGGQKPAEAATPAVQQALPPPAQPHPQDAQMVQIARDRLKKNPQDASALEVLRLNGVAP